MVLGGVLAAGLWWVIVNKDRSRALTQPQKITSIILAVDTTIFAIGSLLGFLGTVIKQRTFIRLYRVVLCYHLGLSIGLGVLAIIFLFRNNQKIIDTCINGSTDPYVIKVCHNAKFKWFAIGFLVILWVLQLYCIIIVGRYDEQLGDERNEKRASAMPLSSSYNYQPAASREHLAAPAGYPYKDANHSYGNGGV